MQYCGDIAEEDRKGFLFTDVLDGNGLTSPPNPVSPPGHHAAQYFTAGRWVTKDPDETGVAGALAGKPIEVVTCKPIRGPTPRRAADADHRLASAADGLCRMMLS